MNIQRHVNFGEMDFGVLGPLEVRYGGRHLPMGGIQQRAVLGYLLMHPNQVIATSQFVNALWQDTAPLSARKMVQNKIWRLRTLLEPAGPATTAVSLRSRPPGYLLEVDPKAVDLHRFNEFVTLGRVNMRVGAITEASENFRQALDLWRGPVLSDLVDAGMSWPKLEATEMLRLDVLEEYFEAQLKLGAHEEILPDLEATVRAQPRRERLVGQLMVALYRSGRQTDALAVFAGERTHLAEELGLEPGKDLQELQRAILAHDPELLHIPRPRGVEIGSPHHPPLDLAPARPAQERKEVTFTLISTVAEADHDRRDPTEVDAAAEAVHQVVTTQAARFGGTVAARIGPLWLIVFGTGSGRDDDPMRAVLTAQSIRYQLRGRRVLFRATVDTGEALVRRVPGDRPSVSGTVVDSSHSVLPVVPPNELWISAAVRDQVRGLVSSTRARFSARMWAVTGVHPWRGDGRTPVVGRENELRVLMSTTDRTGAPNRLTLVIGDSGMGKSALLNEFEQRLGCHDPVPTVARLLPNVVDDSPLALIAPQLARCCGIGADDSPQRVQARLWETVTRVTADLAEAQQVYDALLVPLGDVPGHDLTTEDVLAAWCTLLRRLATERPVTVVVDDLHTADETVLEFVDRLLAVPGTGGLSVVAAARPELFTRRPDWRPAGSEILTVGLTPLADATIAQVARAVLAERGRPADDLTSPTAELVSLVVGLAEGNPLFATEFTRTATRLLGSDAMPDGRGPFGMASGLVPPVVRRMVTAKLDALPERLRWVVQDAAVVGDVVRPDTVAALRPDDPDVSRALAELANRGVLASLANGHFAFRQRLLRDLAYARIPERARADKRMTLASRAGSVAPSRPSVALELMLLRSVILRLRN